MRGNRENSIAFMKTVFLSVFCVYLRGVKPYHYRIQHSQDRVSGDEEIKRRKNSRLVKL